MEKIFRYDDVPVLDTTSGQLKGYFYDGAYIFKGIPYAHADRFQMPAESKWEGVKEATSYGFVCPLMSQETPNGELLVPHRYWPMDEHCQNLNIWTDTLDENAKKPVVIWLHGGGYFAGSSIEQEAYDGSNMCKQGGVVVVSVNHRLNILGYLDLSPFGEKYRNSGNAGHADMVAALKWVHENISLFGGNPDNVTVFGQSGGGMKVADLMQIAEADGLFHKGLIMSGVGSATMLPSCKGDGRELVITDDTAVKLRAEDGRSIASVDISPFIGNLPNKRDTAHFSTEDASGSTSQAANLMEGVEAGCKVFLIDEDTSATNFMIRDQLMQEVISAGEEPITPFICRVNALYQDLGISSIIVAGSSGSYFHVADTVIQMKEYVPVDITERAKEAAKSYPEMTGDREKFPSYLDRRCPLPDMALKKDDRIKIKTMGTSELMLARENVELRYLEQLKDQEQTAALAFILKYAQLKLLDGKKTIKQLGDFIENQLDRDGLESLFERGDISSSLARPRKQEILACVNRYRKLHF